MIKNKKSYGGGPLRLTDGFMKLKMYVCKREDPNRGIDIFFTFFTVKLF